MEERYLSIKSLSRYINITPKGIDHRVRAGKFPRPIRLGAKTLRWDRVEIDRWFDSHRAGGNVEGSDNPAVADVVRPGE